MIGKQLSQYRILESVGAGGMGQVYRALDTKLNRDVALKTLPPELANDERLLARFEREARVVASLNHPNIAAIHGFEESDGIRFLVLEYVPGEDLGERLSRGPLSHRETLDLAEQLSEAMEAAHTKGIIHRDLKPANVKVTPEGKVKVLDFGLAKALQPEAEDADLTRELDAASGLTSEGVILGTVSYMSPEQARGKPLDRRTDIWSFGCLIYECLTGKRAFPGRTSSDTLAAILKSEPDWDALPADTAPGMRRLLRRCLQKNPRQRLHDVSDVRIEIEETSHGTGLEALPAAPAAPRPMWRRVLPWGTLAVLAVALGLIIRGAVQTEREGEGTAELIQVPLALPPSGPLYMYGSANTVISPDGTTLAYVSRPGGGAYRLYSRSLADLEATPIPGTEGARSPFFSPDGKWIAYFSNEQLMKSSIDGTSTVALCDAPSSFGGSWRTDDTIIYSPLPTGGLWRVSAGGGDPEPLTSPDGTKGEISHRWPQVIPKRNVVLFTIKTESILSFDDAVIAALDMETNEIKTVLEGGSFGRYLPTGHLVYTRDGAMFAARFDLNTLRMTGTPIRVLDSVMTNGNSGGSHFSFSETGTLVYDPSGPVVQRDTLVWVDRAGRYSRAGDVHRRFFDPRISPDGALAVLWIPEANDKLWIYDVDRESLSRLTYGAGNESDPIWTPDGTRITYISDRDGVNNIFWVAADGSGEGELLVKSENDLVATSWSPVGKRLAFTQTDPRTGDDIWILDMEKDEEPHAHISTPFQERNAIFSPDGRWLAYESDASGDDEIYVQPYPSGAKIRVSRAGGVFPRWSRDGRELVFRSSNHVMTASVETANGFRTSVPRPMFKGLFAPGYDISPSGDRLLMIKSDTQRPDPSRLNLVMHWFDRLRAQVPIEGS